MIIPNIKYRVSRKKKKKHYNTCNNNNCIEQSFKNKNTQWSGEKISDKWVKNWISTPFHQ